MLPFPGYVRDDCYLSQNNKALKLSNKHYADAKSTIYMYTTYVVMHAPFLRI